MKRIAVSILVCGLIVLFSCKKDESYISMSAMEGAIWIEINEFRTDSGKSAATANYDTMVEQAKYYSAFRASGNEDPGNVELQDVWFTIHDRWGGTNDVSITSKVIKESADISVRTSLILLKIIRNLLQHFLAMSILGVLASPMIRMAMHMLLS